MQGQQIRHYQIIEQIGQGGMAVVYKALDTRLEREVAIKIIRRGAFPPDDLDRILKRFEREAKSLARLSHPHIVKVLDSGEHDGSPYLVLEYLPGGTLKERLNGAMPWDQAVALLLPIAHALHYAHQQGFIHRDIKPANILLAADGQPMLSDFGIAKLLTHEETQTLTGTGMGVGTPEYMAPEQGMGGEADVRSDIYALGVVLYEMVTGRKPFQGETPLAVVFKHVNEPLEKPSRLVRGLSRPVERVLLKALAKKPQKRYRDMAVFADELEKLLDGKLLVQEERSDGFDVTHDQLVLPKRKRHRNSEKPGTRVPIWGWIAVGAILAGLAAWGVLQLVGGNQVAVSLVTETVTATEEIQVSPSAVSTTTSAPTQTPTASFTSTSTATKTPTQSPTLTASVTPTASQTILPTNTLSLTITHTEEPLGTPQPVIVASIAIGKNEQGQVKNIIIDNAHIKCYAALLLNNEVVRIQLLDPDYNVIGTAYTIPHRNSEYFDPSDFNNEVFKVRIVESNITLSTQLNIVCFP